MSTANNAQFTTFRNEQWRLMDAGSRRHCRWLYRTMRRAGITRSAARMYLGGALNSGYTAGIRRGMQQ